MADQTRTIQHCHAQEHSSLLSLPPELRNTIYELVLGSQTALWSSSTDECYLCSVESDIEDPKLFRPHHYESPENTVTLTALPPQHHTCSSRNLLQCSRLSFLLTCRQVYIEAGTIFYRLNHIRYQATDPIWAAKPGENGPSSFILSLSKSRQRALRKVTMTAPTMALALAELEELLLPIATNLRTLYLELPVREFWLEADAVKWAVRAQDALQNTGVTSVKVVDSGALGMGFYVYGVYGLTGDVAGMIEGMLMSAIRKREMES